MKTLSHFFKGFSLSARLLAMARAGRVKVAVIIGGAFQGLARWPHVTGCHLKIYVDVAAELLSTEPADGVICVRLALGHTIGTLIEIRCPEALKRFLESHPGVNLAVGLAQLRGIGKLAIEELLTDPTFKHFVRTQIIEPLRILTNGSLVQVDFVTYASGAGGTGGPVANIFLAAVAAMIEKSSDAVVDLLNVRAGSLSYVGLGDRTDDNAAVTLGEDLHWILAMARHPREVRRLYLTELPIVLGDKELRSAYAVQLAQALNCADVQQTLEMVAPNLATQTQLGTVSIFDVKYWNALGPRRIAEDACQVYSPDLEDISATSARLSRLQNIATVPTFTQTDAKSLEDLVAEVQNSKWSRPENLVEQCLQISEAHSGGTVTVTITQTESFELTGEMMAVFRRPVFTQAEWKKKMETIRTTLTGLDKEITSREPEIAKMDRKLQRATRELEKALELHYPKGIFKTTVAFLANPQKKLVALQNAITRCRELTRQKLQLTSEVDLLSGVRARLQDVLKDEERRLEAVLNLLRPFQQPVQHSGGRCSEIVPLDDVLPRLLALAEQGKCGDEVLRTLSACVARVTLKGLADMVDANEPQPASIAQRLLGAEPPVRGPYWGGRIPTAAGMRIVVLPPVEGAILHAVRAHFSNMNGNTMLMASDTAQAGANVVELNVRQPREFEEVLTPLLAAALQEVSDMPALYTGENDPSLPWARGLTATRRIVEKQRVGV